LPLPEKNRVEVLDLPNTVHFAEIEALGRELITTNEPAVRFCSRWCFCLRPTRPMVWRVIRS